MLRATLEVRTSGPRAREPWGHPAVSDATRNFKPRRTNQREREREMPLRAREQGRIHSEALCNPGCRHPTLSGDQPSSEVIQPELEGVEGVSQSSGHIPGGPDWRAVRRWAWATSREQHNFVLEIPEVRTGSSALSCLLYTSPSPRD
eukprot:7751632-Alexandrium_andersonii.AAC.2